MKKECKSQVDYKEAPYEATSWEIVGNYHPDRGFIPITLDILDESNLVVDPVFADYGGIPHKGDKRLHLPESEAFDLKKYEDKPEQEEDEEEKDFIKLKQEEIDKITKEAYDKGFEEATIKANAQKEFEENDLKNQVNLVLDDLKTQIQEYKNDIEKEALNLSINIASKIINHTVKENPEYILEVIHTALESIKGATIKKIRVSTQSFGFLKSINKKEEFSNVENDFEFVADDTINKGCVIESSLGDANFDLDSAFKRLVYGITR